MPSDFKVSVKLDDGQFSPTVVKMRKETEALAQSFKALSDPLGLARNFTAGILGGTVANSLFGLFERGKVAAGAFGDKLAEIGKQAKALNVSPELVQKVSNAMGGDFESAARGLEKIAEAQQKILNGEDKDFKIAESFKKIGVSLSDIKKEGFAELFERIARAVKDADINSSRLVSLREVLGKSSLELISGFQKGFDSPLAGAGVVSGETIQAVKDLRRKISENQIEEKNIEAETHSRVTKFFLNVGALFSSITGAVVNPVGYGYRHSKYPAAGRPETFGPPVAPGFEEERAQKEIDAAAKEAELEEHAKKAGELERQNAEKRELLFRKEQDAESHRADLMRHIRDVDDQIRNEKDPLHKQELIRRRLGYDEEIRGIHPDTAARYSIQPDALKRIGGFRGGIDRSAAEITLQKQLTVQENTLGVMRVLLGEFQDE